MERDSSIFKEGLRKEGVVRDENDSPTVRQILKELAKKFNYSVSSLHHDYHFAREYPQWSDFEKAKFELRKKVGHYCKTIIKSGAEVTWTQVLYKVLFPRNISKQKRSDRYVRHHFLNSQRNAPFLRVPAFLNQTLLDQVP